MAKLTPEEKVAVDLIKEGLSQLKGVSFSVEDTDAAKQKATLMVTNKAGTPIFKKRVKWM